MPQTISKTSSNIDHINGTGAYWSLPLQASLEKINGLTTNKVTQLVLKGLAYLTFGFPALIGACLKHRAISQAQAELEKLNPRTEKMCKIFKTTLKGLNKLFDNSRQGYESYVINFEKTPNLTYDQNRRCCIKINRALTNKEIGQLVGSVRERSQKGFLINRIEIEASNRPNPQLLNIGFFQRAIFANIDLYLPDQLPLEDSLKQVIEFNRTRIMSY